MKNKIKSFFKSAKVKKIGVVVMSLAIMAFSCISCFATDGTAPAFSADTNVSIATGVKGIFDELTTIFSFTNLLSFIAIGVVAAATIVLGYIGLRKLVSMITKALKGRFKAL